jgi:hypothetical protein
MTTKKTYIGSESFLRIPLYDSNGTVLSPTVALDLALQDGPIPEQHLLQLAQEYTDPSIVAHTLERLGAVRVRQDDGTVMVELPKEASFKFATEPGTDNEGYPYPPTRDKAGGGDRVVTAEGTAGLTIGFASGSSALDDWERTGGNLVAWREATRAGVKLGDCQIISRGNERYITKADFDRITAQRRRSAPTGAGSVAAGAVDKGQSERLAASKDPGLANARRGRAASRQYKTTHLADTITEPIPTHSRQSTPQSRKSGRYGTSVTSDSQAGHGDTESGERIVARTKRVE